MKNEKTALCTVKIECIKGSGFIIKVNPYRILKLYGYVTFQFNSVIFHDL